MIIKVLSSYYDTAFSQTVKLLREAGHDVFENGALFCCDLIVCPDYDVILSERELSEARIGVLVFHPSPLPRMRGRNAIKRQYNAGDKIGGGTWFWASSGIDNGDICEQELVIIDPQIRPREYYQTKIIPLMLRSLERAISGIESGRIRKIKQIA